MVKIRLKRMGRTHRPFYRISVMDARKARDGRSIEDIGYYDPMIADKSQRVSLKLDRLEHWLSELGSQQAYLATGDKSMKALITTAKAPGESQVVPEK